MLPNMPLGQGAVSDEKKLQQCFRSLNAQDKISLLSFAEFLSERSQRNAEFVTEIPEPLTIARPEQESVIKAIQRLTSSYFMLDRDKLLHQTSALMTEHIMHGRTAQAVIDELEVLFAGHYQQMKIAVEHKE